MKRDKIIILAAELVLLALAVFFVNKIFADEEPQKRVAVIVENSGDRRWDALFKGLMHSADMNNIHLIICNTDNIENAEDERALIEDQYDNNVDAYVICPAPGENTAQVIEEACGDKPVVLITEDMYSGEVDDTDEDTVQLTEFPTIKPDNYKMGKSLGEEIKKNGGDLSGVKIGIYAGREKTEATISQIKGLKDALADTGCEIAWTYYYLENQNVCSLVNNSRKVDYICAMDTYVLDTLGEAAEAGSYNGAQIYGIGTSMKSVSLLDYGRIKCLIMPDGYGIGYESISEIAKKFDGSFYTIDSQEADAKVIYREDLYSDDMERFLYSYE